MATITINNANLNYKVQNFVSYTDLNVPRMPTHTQYGYYLQLKTGENHPSTVVKLPVVAGHTYKIVGTLYGSAGSQYSYILSTSDYSASDAAAWGTESYIKDNNGFYYPQGQTASTTPTTVEDTFTPEQSGFCYMFVLESELSDWKNSWYLEDITN